MWEAIASNRRRSWILLSMMGLLLLALGAIVGVALAGPNGWLFGAGIALVIWLIMWGVAEGGGDGRRLGCKLSLPNPC